MQTVRKSVIVARPASAMYALVDAYDRYPEFLPWCASGQVLDRTDVTSRARLEIAYHGLRSHIGTFNRMVPDESIDLDFAEGPFEHFHGHWRFIPLGEAGCRVEFSLDYQFASRAIESILGPVFSHIIETLVDQFVARAESLPMPGASPG